MTATRTHPGDLHWFRRACPDCREEIMWARTLKDEWMPLDADPVDGGNVLVFRDDSRAVRRLVCDVVAQRPRREAMAADGWFFWQHHRLSCRYADQWARRTKSQRPQPPAGTTAPTVSTPDAPEGLF